MKPLDYVTSDILQCEWAQPQYLFFSAEVDPLVYYSHLFPAIAILILSALLLFQNRRPRAGKYFIITSLLFSLYAVFDLIVWSSIDPSAIMFFWSMLIYIEPLIYLSVLFLALTFITKNKISFIQFFWAGVLMLPILLFGPTALNLAAFDYTDCWRLTEEGILSSVYVYIVEGIVLLWLIQSAVFHIAKMKNSEHRRESILLTIGSVLFLIALSFGNIFGTLFQGTLGEESWVIAQYGFFGMPVFLAFILYIIVKFKAFDMKIIGTEALTLSLWVLLLALLFINNLDTVRYVLFGTLILFSILGFLLIRSVRREIKQREQIEHLADKLEKANIRLKQLDKLKSEFVSIASHQLRSPLTSIRGYASMLGEGSFGKLPSKAEEPVSRIEESAKLMAMAVEDYLNVSRIESGNMKYNLSDFNLRDQVDNICDDLRPDAIKHGLVLLFRSDLKSRGIVNADIGKTAQIVHNLVNNAIKYTPKGSIKVLVRDDIDKKRIYVDITDTGIGMSQATIDKVFEKFERADNANSVNVSGTGLGLFVALKMAQAMGGDITATSEGDGKGSTFTFELPLAM